jgi:dTDP-4-dehydrorhamnose reductase
MLGSLLCRFFSSDPQFETWGSIRGDKSDQVSGFLEPSGLLISCDLLREDFMQSVIAKLNPHVVINCVGLIKQKSGAENLLLATALNGVMPHRLAKICMQTGARLIHISTDCVFSGEKGMYSERDNPDAEDVYGKSKSLGELVDYPNALTLRTSIIGHELNSNKSLLDWFLSQENEVKGFSRAIFSGVTTFELARIIRIILLEHPSMSGLYHVSSAPIDKYSLLGLVAKIYNKKINIVEDDSLVIDRSLSAEKLRKEIRYGAPSWEKMLIDLYHFYNATKREEAYVYQ